VNSSEALILFSEFGVECFRIPMNLRLYIVSVKGVESFSSSCFADTKSTNNLALKSVVACRNRRYSLQNP